MPLWFAVAVLAREILVGGTIVVATLAFGMERFDVTWWGKTATFLLMFAVPGFLMGHSSIPIDDAFTVAAWCFGIPGLALSYYTAIAYIPMIRDAVARRAGAPPGLNVQYRSTAPTTLFTGCSQPVRCDA